MKAELTAFFERVRPAVDSVLEELLPSVAMAPTDLHHAMRYSVFAGGKRLRPALCMAAYSAYHEDVKPILPVAAAIEMAHTYSLVHDDLPAMDDDDYRRGVPSCHRKFGEATAILAGDALLTLAFEVVASSAIPPEKAIIVIQRFARALGTCDGMIAGQVLDLDAEGKPIGAGELETIHRAKTGALISTAVWIGGFLAGASNEDLGRLTTFGQRIGLAFQIVDDILDETETQQTLGKTAGKDRKKQKATYPALFGLTECRRILRQLTLDARHELASVSGRTHLLLDIAEYLETRSS